MASGLGSKPVEPEAAHDPIAIAALVAELPELEAKFAAAKEIAEAANKALNVIQDRIDTAIAVLKKKAPKGSMWGNQVNKIRREIGSDDLQQALQQYQQQQHKESMAKCAPPPPPMPPHMMVDEAFLPRGIKKGGPWT
jgi:hypothetical protein